MNEFLSLMVVFIIYIPVLFFLPLGFSRNAKYFIAFSSLAFALLGSIMMALFPLWEAVLLLTLLIFSSMYLISRKSGDFLSKADADVSNERLFVAFNDSRKEAKENLASRQMIPTPIIPEEEIKKIDFVIENETIGPRKEIIESPFVAERKIGDEQPDQLNDFNKRFDQMNEVIAAKEANNDFADDISFLEKRIQLLDSGETIFNDSFSDKTISLEFPDVVSIPKEQEQRWQNIDDDFIEEIQLKSLEKKEDKEEEEFVLLFDDVIPELRFDDIDDEKSSK